jgi:hypothetical protein
MAEREKVRNLGDALEMPERNSRWKELDGSLPERAELETKIGQLEERISEKKEQILEKGLILDEVREGGWVLILVRQIPYASKNIYRRRKWAWNNERTTRNEMRRDRGGDVVAHLQERALAVKGRLKGVGFSVGCCNK